MSERLGTTREGALRAGRDRRLSIVLRPPARIPRMLGIVLILAVLGALSILVLGTGYSYSGMVQAPARRGPPTPTDTGALKKLLPKLRTQNKQLVAALQKNAPKGTYVVVDQTQNRLYVKRDEQLLHEAVCSAGSGMVLKESGGKGRRWVFDTPRGVFKVRNKIVNPPWKAPDWHFVEEGRPIPTKDADRIEYGTLGEYALYLEDGYMIHGTLYERLLGRSVTHGCIRLGRDDLRVIWKDVPIGTPVYIY